MDFIIRIYRFEQDKPRSLVGIAEEVETKGKKGFNTYDELWEILNSGREALPPEKLGFTDEVERPRK
jgi:hypothetical protein